MKHDIPWNEDFSIDVRLLQLVLGWRVRKFTIDHSPKVIYHVLPLGMPRPILKPKSLLKIMHLYGASATTAKWKILALIYIVQSIMVYPFLLL